MTDVSVILCVLCASAVNGLSYIKTSRLTTTVLSYQVRFQTVDGQ
jgi:hypothetical protein